MDDIVSVDVQIMDKDYRISCPVREKDALMSSVRMVNKRINEVQKSGSVLGAERLAVMAALHIANELINSRSSEGMHSQAVSDRLQSLQSRVESALQRNQELFL